jgi:hypothetical protein
MQNKTIKAIEVATIIELIEKINKTALTFPIFRLRGNYWNQSNSEKLLGLVKELEKPITLHEKSKAVQAVLKTGHPILFEIETRLKLITKNIFKESFYVSFLDGHKDVFYQMLTDLNDGEPVTALQLRSEIASIQKRARLAQEYLELAKTEF